MPAMAKVKSVTVSVGDSIEEAKKALLIATLKHFDGDKRLTAQTLGISYRNVYNLMRRYGLFVKITATVEQV